MVSVQMEMKVTVMEDVKIDDRNLCAVVLECSRMSRMNKIHN